MSELPPIYQKYGIDATDFKTGISEINRRIRLVESGFRASAAGLGDWGKDASALELRMESLNEKIDLQREKVERTRAEYEKIREEKGDNSRASQELQIKLNKETEALGNMEREMRDTKTALDGLEDESDDAGDEMKELADKTDKAKESTGGLKSVLGGLGGLLGGAATAVAGLAVAAGAAALAIGGLVFHVADMAGELVDMSLKTGISTTSLQELDFVAGQVGTSTDDITGSLSRMIRSMGDAKDQSEDYADKLAEAQAAGTDIGDIDMGPAAAAFAELGISVTDAGGQLRDSEEVFYDVIDALGKIPNATERDALAMEIFGRSAMELNPLIIAGSDEIARLREEAHEMGAVIEEDGIAAAEGFGDKLAAMGAGLKGVAGTIGLLFLPAFDGIADLATGALKELVDVIGAADGDIGVIAEGATRIVADLVGELLKQVPGFLEAGLGIIQGIIDAVMTYLPGLIPVAINVIQTLVGFLIESLPFLVDSGIQIILALINGILPLLPMLMDVALKAIVTLATGIAAAAPELIPALVETVLAMVDVLIENIPLLLDAALLLIQALAEGLVAALPILIPEVPKIIEAVYDLIIESLPIITDAAVELILTLVDGLISNLPEMADAGTDIVQAYIDATMAMIPAIWDVGVALVTGVWNGILSKKDQFTADIQGYFSGIVGGVKDILGIRSPSAVFAGIGGNMVAGLVEGFAGEMSAAERNIARQVGKVTAGLETGLTIGNGNLNINGGQGGQSQRAQAPINITIQAEVRDEVDYYRMARVISEQISRGR